MTPPSPPPERRGGLEGRVVVVTGAGRGIGRAIAERFGREGAHVLVSARRIDAAEAVVSAIRAVGGTASAAPADVTVAADVDRLFGAALAVGGRVDVLVNNAALVEMQPHALALAGAELDRFLATNVTGAFRGAARAGREMARQRRGAIVNVSSVVATRPGRRMVAYAASKAALDGLTRALALDRAPFGVRVNAVAPGIVWTPEREAAAAPEEAALRRALLPLGRISRPEDVAAACAFLASDDADAITGQVLCVDGGLTTQVRPMADDPGRFEAGSIEL